MDNTIDISINRTGMDMAPLSRGERLAFERAGTRLYETMLFKCGAVDAAAHPVDVAALARIRDDEESHFRLVHKFLERLGADPTAMTPSERQHLAMVRGWLREAVLQEAA